MAMLLFKTAKARKAELPIMKLLGDTPETLDTGEGDKQQEPVACWDLLLCCTVRPVPMV